MADLEIVDIHTHTFASADRGIAWQRSAGAGRREPTRNGTIEELRGLMAEAGITYSNMLMYTPTLFADPLYMDEATLVGEIEDEVQRVARSVKVVLLALAIYADDWRNVYECISQLGVPIVSQSGAGGSNGDRGEPWGRRCGNDHAMLVD